MTLAISHTTPTGAAVPVLAVRDLTVAFPPARAGRGPDGAAPTIALEGLSLDVAHGEFVAVLGPSGCGKSTLLRAWGGLLDPRATVTGEVVVPRASDGSRATAWMPQRDGLLPWRRALSNALVGAIAAGVPREHALPRARALFAEFDLGGFEDAWPHELSGGMRQRLALLRTRLANKPVLLLDEPFGALDPVTRRRMNAWLATVDLMSLDAERAVVLVTHDVDEAIALADRIVVMSERPGRIVHEAAARGTQRYDRASLLAALDG